MQALSHTYSVNEPVLFIQGNEPCYHIFQVIIHVLLLSQREKSFHFVDD